MLQATVRSRCECQASLVAVLNEQRFVLHAYAAGSDRERVVSPANSMKIDQERFDLGWLCPICGRNTLRSFSSESLAWREAVVEAKIPVSLAPTASPALPSGGK